MALVDMRDMLGHAYDNGYAVGAFAVTGLEFLEGVIQAAERCRAPVIIDLTESHFSHYAIDLLMPAVESAARRSAVPVAIHHDHGSSPEQAVAAVRRGCNGVMIDASNLSLEENLDLTKRTVAVMHDCGIPVEAELGYVPGDSEGSADDHLGELRYTTVEEARGFVRHTGVDLLAVSVGTVHGRFKGKTKLDYQRLRQINEALQIPLVIHGGSGLADDQIHRLIQGGVAKINFYSGISQAVSEAVQGYCKGSGSPAYFGLVDRVREVIAAEVERTMRLLGSSGRAAEVIARCRPWGPVERLLLFNAEVEGQQELRALMDQVPDELRRLPGVRAVTTAGTIQAGAEYRFCWRLTLAGPRVTETLSEHPERHPLFRRLFTQSGIRPLAVDLAEG